MKRGIFVGRFSPFHLGHLENIKLVLNQVDELIIGIGSAQQSHTLSNPFTSGERLFMIHQTLQSEKISLERIFLVPIWDIFRNPVWVNHVQSLCPPFSVVFTNNSLIRRLFSESGFEVESPELVKRTVYKGSHIRQLMIEGDKWEHLVPSSVIKIIMSIDGVERLQHLNQQTD
ncbi:MAG: nicotinamide-nucleotide adenylyltransferase [Candidatus Heimdallarchaeota archaeon]|nr:nicotinamide-nucleotide adenylyltransferase [Candidatus Heimdallarchaeota archaeon]